MKRTYLPILGLVTLLWLGTANAAEYPIQAGSQGIFDATTMGMGTPLLAIRYELWVLEEREPGKFAAVWVFFNNPRKPEESLAGALPLTIDKHGAKQFPREREVTYVLQETSETFMPDLTSAGAFDKVWKGPVTVTGRYFSYQPLGVEKEMVHCSFAQYGEANMDQIVDVLTTGDGYFDPKTGWLRSMVLTTMRQSTKETISKATARLTKVVQQNGEWVAKRREEAMAFFNSLQQHDDLLYKANDDLSAATMTLAPIEQMWQTYTQASAASIFLPLAKSHVLVMKSELPALQGLWLARKKVVGTPSPDWTLKDTSGTPYSLSTAEGKPVLLLFWSKMSWESLMAMRELVQMKAAYEPRGLLVLPINLDAADQDATNALTTLGVKMGTLRNTDPNLLAAYGIPLGVLPSAVVLDRTHKIADVHYGWGKRVFSELRKKIEMVLTP